MTIVDLVGILYYWDVTINGVVTTYVLVCVGLAVDYAAHIGHAFEDAYGSSEQRATEAVLRMGTAVSNGVVSTMMAVLVFSISKTYIFRVFFKAFFIVTVIGGAHGLVLLPVLLSLLGGDRPKPKDIENNDGNKANRKASAEFQAPADDAYEDGNVSPVDKKPIETDDSEQKIDNVVDT